MTLETDCLEQDAVVWEHSGVDNYGNSTVGSATALNVRWEYVTEENLDPDTSNQAVTARVWVNQDIAIGSILWEGALADLPGTPTPLYQVISLKKIPDIKNRNIRRMLTLINFNNTVPS